MTAAHAQRLTAPTELRLASPTHSAEMQLIEHHQVRITGLNPRKAFNAQTEKELAQSIYERTVFDAQGKVLASGIEQNLIGRPREGGGVDLAAGERRYRAVTLLIQGFEGVIADGVDANNQPKTTTKFMQVLPSYPLPFTLKAMTDAELLEVATLENIMREDMTVLEIADAFLNLKAQGRDEVYIGLKYGKHPAQVSDLIRLAAGLGKEGRKLLESGDIGAEHAKLIASASGPLKKSLLEQAKAGASVLTLKHLLRNGAFLVDNALFDVEASGLSIERALLGDMAPKFSDPKAALALQLSALEQLRVEQRDSWDEVVILATEHEFARLPETWVQRWAVPHGMPKVLAMVYSTTTGTTQMFQHVARQVDAQAYRKAQLSAEKQQRPLGEVKAAHAGVREAATSPGNTFAAWPLTLTSPSTNASAWRWPARPCCKTPASAGMSASWAWRFRGANRRPSLRKAAH